MSSYCAKCGTPLPIDSLSDADDTIVVPMKSKKQFKLDRTNLLAKLGKAKLMWYKRFAPC